MSAALKGRGALFSGLFDGGDPEETYSYLHLPNRPAILTMRERRRLWGGGYNPPRHPDAQWGDYSNEP